jgi:hypothetical protein
MTPWLITINYSSQCHECADAAAFQAHSADVARKAWMFMEKLVDNEAAENRLPCGCHWGAARVTAALSKDLEARFRSVVRTRPAAKPIACPSVVLVKDEDKP